MSISSKFLGLVVSLAPALAAAELTYVTHWGEYGFAPDQFNYPTGIALGPNGDVYVTDGGNDRVTRFTPDGDYVATIGSFGSGPGQFNRPDHLQFSPTNGDLYVTDLNNHRVQRFTPEGAFVLKWGSFGNGEGQFAGPWGIHVDAAGDVYVISQGQERIQKFTENGVFLMQWGIEGTLPGQFMKPRSVTTDAQGNIYISDVMRHDVQKFDPNAEYLLEWGEPGSLPGQFLHPYHLSYVDGQIVVVDWLEHPHGGRLTAFTTMGVLTEVLVDGPQGIGELEFNTIWAAAYDGGTDWYVVEWENHRVQKLREPAVGVDILPTAANMIGNPSPNPSSGVVRIQLNLPHSNSASVLEILDVQGRRVFAQPLHETGPYEFLWNGTDDAGRIAAAGIYFITLRGPSFEQVRRFARIR